MDYLIAFIAPFNNLAYMFHEISQELNREVLILTAPLKSGAVRAVELEQEGVDVLISRGGTTIAINKVVKDIPVIDIQVSGYDLMRAINQARRVTSKLALVGFEPFTHGMQRGLGNIFDLDLKVLTLTNEVYQRPAYIEEELQKVIDTGYHCVVGNDIAVRTARKMGMKGFLIKSGRETLINALLEAERVAIARRKEKEKTNRIKCIVDSVHEGIISINREGLIHTFNPGAEKIFNREAKTVLGKDINQVFPEMKMLCIEQIDNKDRECIINVGSRKVAMHYIPFKVDDQVMGVVATCQKVSHIQKMEQKIRQELYLKGHVAEHSISDIIGQSREINKAKEEARDFAAVNSPLLIYGETGTGKELFAQAIHNISPRKNKPFVAFNCAALPENLLESELFGYVKGAFTGALNKGKAGFFEMAHEGTIFLDEVGEISLDIQVRLLRIIEEGKVRRLGDDKLTPIDVRIITATNKDIYQMVKERRFREDLFYRINVLNLYLPPLRERREDIPLLVDFFIKKYSFHFNSNPCGISNTGMEFIKGYDWPGNIRELANIVERLVIRSKGGITDELVRETIQSAKGKKGKVSHDPVNNGLPILTGTLENFQTSLIEKVLREEKGNKTAAARRLGISRTTIWRKLNES